MVELRLCTVQSGAAAQAHPVRRRRQWPEQHEWATGVLVERSAVAAVVVFAGCARAVREATPERPAPVVVSHSESYVMRPRAGGDAYRISVGLPLSYATDPERQFPVLYVLDADVGFGSAVEVTRFLALSREIPEVIVVGIGYGAGLATWRTRRVSDLTPVPAVDQPGSGRASVFLDFIVREVIPLVESRYRATGDRTLLGYSHGGLFGTYVLFHRPGIFQRYILGSPSYGWAGRAALQWPAAVGRAGPLPTGLVFTSVGREETPAMLSNWRTFWDAVEALAVPGLRVTRGEIDETHAASWPHAAVKGLKTVWR